MTSIPSMMMEGVREASAEGIVERERVAIQEELESMFVVFPFFLQVLHGVFCFCSYYVLCSILFYYLCDMRSALCRKQGT